MLSRAVAAVLGGYVVSALSTSFLGLALPLGAADAVLIATMLSVVVYAVAVLWVFAAASAGHAWLGIVLCGLTLGVGMAVLS